jgi:beta-glucuronidase
MSWACCCGRRSRFTGRSTWENPATLQNARQQLNDLIVRDHNRASVIIWSVANETPPGEARTNFLRNW